MHTSHTQLPNLQTLTNNLNSILNEYKATDDQVTILAREPNIYTSTFQSEIVTCKMTDGRELRLLCKYGAEQNHNLYGHRGGVSYEAEVYRHVLQQVPVATPIFFGSYKDTTSGEMWLVIENFDEILRLMFTYDLAVIRAAARWLGRFHKASESILSQASLHFLNKHDANYYLGWAKRTSLFAGRLHEQYPWLMTICERFEEVVDTLLKPPNVIIHGEYYPMNILYFQQNVYPIDWETAAVAIGEIDLSSLIESWPKKFVVAAKAEYQQARWPKSPPADFMRKLDIAQLYWHFRWLGDRPEWSQDQEATSRIERFRSLGELGKQLGLI